MNKNLLFDFSVNKENKTIHVKREFDAGIDLVWAAWTQAELLDQWWAPKPYRAETKSMDFKEGGAWVYTMVGPENDVHWARLDYEKIQARKSFSGLDAFCDNKGAVNPELPRSHWNSLFSEKDGTTMVNVQITFKQLADLEKTIEMGFKEGFTMGLGNLDELLKTMK